VLKKTENGPMINCQPAILSVQSITLGPIMQPQHKR